jgi:hypothetical protein
MTFRLTEVKDGGLLWKATHGDLDLAFNAYIVDNRGRGGNKLLLKA